MVRSKDVTKKKKDPLLTPPAKLRGFLDDDHGGGRPRNRGGEAMSPAPAPASVPNYMRATSSSDAKGGRRARATASASASPARRRPAVRVVTRGKVLFPDAPAVVSGSGGLARATCSSTMKESKFPAALDLAPGATKAEGPAAMRVCPYTYCSLNGHAHAPAVPLRSFLASQRRLIKTQQSMKIKGVSAFRKKAGEKNGGGGGAAAAAKVAPLIDQEAVGDFFVEVYAGPRVSSDMSCSDMSLDEMDTPVRRLEFVMFDRCGADGDQEKKGEDLALCGDDERHPGLEEKHGACRDSSSECSGADIGGDFVEEVPWMRYQGYEYDSFDDEISEEQRMEDEEIGRAEVPEEQEGKDEAGTSGRSDDECEAEVAGEEEANDVENSLNFVSETEILAEQQGVACGVEACEELDGREEDNIPNTGYQGEASAVQGTAEEKLSDDLYTSQIPVQEVAGMVDGSILEDSCKEETSADPERKDDECSVESDGESEVESDGESEVSEEESDGESEVSEEQDVKGEENMPDDGSEMEISEEVVAGDGCREDFSEEVTSKPVLAGEVSDFVDFPDLHIKKLSVDDLKQNDCTADDVFEQYESIPDDSTVHDVFEQDSSLVDGQTDAQKELGIVVSRLEVASNETVISQQTDQESTVDGMEDGRAELEITTQKLEQASEESGVTQESNSDGIATCVDGGAQVEPEITTLKDASEESGITHESILNDNSEHVTEAAEMGPEITTGKLKEASEEFGFGQETAENDDSDDAENDLEISKFKSEDAYKESVTTEEADQSDICANFNSDTRNELTVIAISKDAENESELAACKSEDVSEEFIIGQEVDHDDSAAYVSCGTQNESELITSGLEDAQEESNMIQEDEDEGNTDSAKDGAQNKSGIIACESEGVAEKPATGQEADEHVDTTDASDSAQKDASMPKLDASEDIHITEDTNELFNVQILEHMYDCTADDHVDPQNQAAEFTEKEPSIDDICDAFNGMNLKGNVYFDPAESATCPQNKLIISRRRRTPEEEEYMRGFNPRAPNFLPLELDPDAEKVDLRHQMMDERKNAEEWMIDYALRRAVTTLAPARKKKVELLVQAFETVLPHEQDERKSISPSRHVQTCN
ncbi:hypothetical protein ACP70R_035295 [Stipagrostis hirtigluma subsp. patula]